MAAQFMSATKTRIQSLCRESDLGEEDSPTMSTSRAIKSESKVNPSVSSKTCKLANAYANVLPLPLLMMACSAGMPSARMKAVRNATSVNWLRSEKVVCLSAAGSAEPSFRTTMRASWSGFLTRSKLRKGEVSARVLQGRVWRKLHAAH